MKWNGSPFWLMAPLALSAFPVALLAQQTVPWNAMKPGSDNIEVLGHVPLGPPLSIADMDIEKELDRP